MTKGEKFWCWWLGRSIYYIGETRDGRYLFEDVCDELFTLTKEDLDTLEKINAR